MAVREESGAVEVLRVVTLPGTEASVGLVRRYARGVLGAGFPGLYEVAVVVSELVTNAVRHSRSGEGGGRVRVAFLAGDGVLRLEVTDEGAAGRRPGLREPGPDEEGGRGLQVVEELSGAWGVREEGRLTTVWAEFPTVG